MSQSHWDAVWESHRPDEVSWHQQDPTTSLGLIERVTDPTSAVVDVGGGASRLVDVLLADGYTDLTVIDIAEPALTVARERLGRQGATVDWLVGDVTTHDLPGRFDLWHDRAVLHFLVEEADRSRYREAVRRAVKPGGHVVLATFGPDGPERCSGLPVRRYDHQELSIVLGEDFEPVEFVEELHTTPAGATQKFLYCLLRQVSVNSGQP
jgi:2-polyprenyl-3-methyl-5-hydroxy-6-metoxy-1,4-benzoquinol methylase